MHLWRSGLQMALSATRTTTSGREGNYTSAHDASVSLHPSISALRQSPEILADIQMLLFTSRQQMF